MVEGSSPASRTPRILEIGADDGSVTERLLAPGYSVTTEVSGGSVDSMEMRSDPNDPFTAVQDAGDLQAITGPKFDAVLFASVLHHISDYMSALRSATEQQLREGGSLISLQDPIWFMSDLEERETECPGLRSVVIAHAVTEAGAVPRRYSTSEKVRPLRIGFPGRSLPRGIDRILEAMAAEGGAQCQLVSAFDAGLVLERPTRHYVPVSVRPGQ